ncbi:hypothetical protein [Streptomyces hygroscopicus]|uniref:hypothetical protein n=1 Tax=Streptomyces hygroscopicus TaxID=1912 RepID=UPI000782E903|nr:hypothetical protein [Streptomyces hygroscopicus]
MDLSQLTPLATLTTAAVAVWVSVHTAGAAWRREQTGRQYEALSDFLETARAMTELQQHNEDHPQLLGMLKDQHLFVRLTGVPAKVLNTVKSPPASRLSAGTFGHRFRGRPADR